MVICSIPGKLINCEKSHNWKKEMRLQHNEVSSIQNEKDFAQNLDNSFV